MINNLIFSLNTTIPIFILMLLGMFFKKIGLFDDHFVTKMNQFVFKVCLPTLLVLDLAKTNIRQAWDLSFVLFCFLVTVLSITISYILAKLLIKPNLRAEFIQGSYRSSAAILGIAFIQNIYGHSSMGPLMILGSVPLYNIMAVLILSLVKSDSNFNHDLLKKSIKYVFKNPIIIGIIIGLLLSLWQIPLPKIIDKSATYISNLATPMGLMAMGASFDLKKAFAYRKESLLASFMKLFGFTAIFLPIAIYFGFKGEAIIAILVMLSSATTVTSFVMAKNMGHEGVLSSAIVMITTIGSAFSLTLWLFIIKSLGLI